MIRRLAHTALWNVLDALVPNRDERIVDVFGCHDFAVDARWTVGPYESMALWIFGSVEENPSVWSDMSGWCDFLGCDGSVMTGAYRRRGVLMARLDDFNLRWLKLVLRKKWNRNHRGSIYVSVKSW